MQIGIDLGGTKIEGAALSSDGTTLLRRRIAAPRGDYDATIAAVAELVTGIEAELGDSGTVGVGIPGTISPATGLVKNANSTWLIGHALDADLEAALGRPVRLANDANCFTVSEARDGAGAGAPVVFGVILGTGVGGGLAIDGAAITGANAIAGEWGHNPLPWATADDAGAPCYCGLENCIETFLSGDGLKRAHAAAGGEGAVDALEVARLARAGDPTASEAVSLYTTRLAKALASVINICDPTVIVLGGGLSNIASLYDNVPRLWDAWVFSDSVATRLVPNAHGDSGGVRGAAWLWPAGARP